MAKSTIDVEVKIIPDLRALHEELRSTVQHIAKTYGIMIERIDFDWDRAISVGLPPEDKISDIRVEYRF